MSLVKSQPLKSSLETVGAQVKLEAATAGAAVPAVANLPGCSVRSLLQDMGLQVWPLPTFCSVTERLVPLKVACVGSPIVQSQVDQRKLSLML